MTLKRSITCLLLPMLAVICSCYQVKPFKSPHGYDLVHPHRVVLGNESLHEISGLAFHGNRYDSFFAINDEQGKLYAFTQSNLRPVFSKFGRSGDYEDLTIANGRVVVLKSSGELFSFPFPRLDGSNADSVITLKKLVPKGEYEGLYTDSSGVMYVMCKHCEADNAAKQLSVYPLQPDTGYTYRTGAVIRLDVKRIAELGAETKLRFAPSCLARHPITKEWYIISSVNKMLVVTDDAFTVKEVYHLKPNLFRQPEGMAFDNKGNLYVTNEGRDEDADLLVFPYKP